MTVTTYREYHKGLYGITLLIAESEEGFTYGYHIALPGLVLGRNLHKDPEHVYCAWKPHKALAVEEGLRVILLIVEDPRNAYDPLYGDGLGKEIIEKFFNQMRPEDIGYPGFAVTTLLDLLWLIQ